MAGLCLFGCLFALARCSAHSEQCGVATAELVASLGLPKIPARDLKRALEDAARVRALDKRTVQAVL
jgi:hypothetical protein